MTEVVSVRFKNKGKVYFFDPCGITVKTGQSVIVETAKGLEFAGCTYGNHMVNDTDVVQPLRPIKRLATPDDVIRNEENKKKERDAYDVCQQKIEYHKLDMKLIDVEYNFEGSKILFFFTSDGRVDFRELVKDLAAVFKTRIELRQIGVRDEARMLGGLGICGRPFCCSMFLDEFHPVSIKMAKTQGLSLNPTKISGTCGRLMCCLKHEQEAYEDIVKKAPKNDAFVKTPQGYGSVVSINLLRGYAKVHLEEGNDSSLKQFDFDELEVLGGKGKLAEYLAAKAEGRLEQAGFAPVIQKPAEPPKFIPSIEPVPTPKEKNQERPQNPPRRQKQDTPKQDNVDKPDKQERPENEQNRGKNNRQNRPQKQSVPPPQAEVKTADAQSQAKTETDNNQRYNNRNTHRRPKRPPQDNRVENTPTESKVVEAPQKPKHDSAPSQPQQSKADGEKPKQNRSHYYRGRRPYHGKKVDKPTAPKAE